MFSITSSHHTISESPKNKFHEHISNIIPIITTIPTHSSTKNKSNQKYISKIKETVENLKIKNLKIKKIIPSRPYANSSTDCNRVETNSKYSESNLPIQQLLIPVTNGTSQTSLVPPASHTVDIQDPKKFPLTKPTNTST